MRTTCCACRTPEFAVAGGLVSVLVSGHAIWRKFLLWTSQIRLRLLRVTFQSVARSRAAKMAAAMMMACLRSCLRCSSTSFLRRGWEVSRRKRTLFYNSRPRAVVGGVGSVASPLLTARTPPRPSLEEGKRSARIQDSADQIRMRSQKILRKLSELVAHDNGLPFWIEV